MEGNCELCGKWGHLEVHHIFFGTGKRKLSDQYGAVINLCRECHREGKHRMHRSRYHCLQVQEREQRRLMAEYGWSVQDFIKIFGKNYT